MKASDIHAGRSYYLKGSGVVVKIVRPYRDHEYPTQLSGPGYIAQDENGAPCGVYLADIEAEAGPKALREMFTF